MYTKIIWMRRLEPCAMYVEESEQHLEGWVGVYEELLEVGLEPSSGFRSGLQGVLFATVVVVASGSSEGSAVTLTTRLHPDKGINKRRACVGRGTKAKAGADGIAPVTPSQLASGLLTGAALVNDEVSVPSLSGEEGLESLDVVLLIIVGVA